MKNKFLIGGLAAVMMAGSLASCSSDYLDLKPVTNITNATVTGSEEGLKTAHYGLCRAMYMQYSKLDGYLWMNGEPYCAMLFGDIFSPDYYSYFWAFNTGNNNFNWKNVNMENGWIASMMWRYAYTLIADANFILGGVDNAAPASDGSRNNLDYYKAAALTIRAHAYFRLLQVYAPRWEDSNNGNYNCIVIRRPGDGVDVPISTMAETVEMITEDLKEAIRLFDECGVRRSYNWEPDGSIARGVLARVALLVHDYDTAQKMAHDARANYPIMSMDEYKGGFAEANAEWMWNNACSIDGIFYWAFGSVYACNGPYPTLWGMGAGAINYDLYRKMDVNDGRRDLFWTPDKPLQRLEPESFWNEEVCNPASMDLNHLDRFMVRSIAAYGQTMVPNGDEGKWGLPYVQRESNGAEGGVNVAFGAQYKFWCVDNAGTTSFPFMRAAEMLLTEAEAAYYNQQEGRARECLNELNSKRITDYNCTKSGQDLLEEIRLSRRIELWGEGHNWFDMKRWNLPCERRAWVAGDPTSNNIPAANALLIQPDEYTGWTWPVPRIETDYNDAIDRTQLGRR